MYRSPYGQDNNNRRKSSGNGNRYKKDTDLDKTRRIPIDKLDLDEEDLSYPEAPPAPKPYNSLVRENAENAARKAEQNRNSDRRPKNGRQTKKQQSRTIPIVITASVAVILIVVVCIFIFKDKGANPDDNQKVSDITTQADTTANQAVTNAPRQTHAATQPTPAPTETTEKPTEGTTVQTTEPPVNITTEPQPEPTQNGDGPDENINMD